MKKEIIRFCVICLTVCGYGEEKAPTSESVTEFYFNLAKNKDKVTQWVVPIPERFSVTCDITQNGIFGREFIPEGETFESWTEIITVQSRNVIPDLKQFMGHLKLGVDGKKLEHAFSVQEEKNTPVGIYIYELPAMTITQDKHSRMKQEKIPGINEIIGTKAVQGARTISTVQYTTRYNTKKTTPKKKLILLNKMRTFLDQCHIVENNSDQVLISNDIYWLRRFKIFGKIANGFYYSPHDLFSCREVRFGSEESSLKDGFEQNKLGFIRFTDRLFGNFVEVHVMVLPDKPSFKNVFTQFVLPLIKDVQKGEGVKIVAEEAIGNIFFAAVSIDKQPDLQDVNRNFLKSVQSHVIFEENGKYVVLSNQLVVPVNEKYDGKAYLKKLKDEIFDFKKTFVLGKRPEKADNF
jgi:hypothetical protein